MILKKTYYSISEVSRMLDIQEHTIRFWDSKLPNLSQRDNTGRTRFFNSKQIEKLSKLKDILKKNDSISLAYQILSKNNDKKLFRNFKNIQDLNSDSLKYRKNTIRIKSISNNLKKLLT